jgi:hypothetical protein
VQVLFSLTRGAPCLGAPIPCPGNLTRLGLAGVQGNADVLNFFGCRSLEELKMVDYSVGSLDVHSQSLKHLSMKYCYFYSNYCTALCFPNLVSFKFITNVGRAPLLEIMPLLETAMILEILIVMVVTTITGLMITTVCLLRID